MNPERPTAAEFHAILMRLGLEAFDRMTAMPVSLATPVDVLDARDIFERHLRERAAQGATVYAEAASTAAKATAERDEARESHAHLVEQNARIVARMGSR